ncbi:hypothetical protein [Rubritalea tangerina]|uniref:hypothetical protein n=1 Tax=Rubritalea tangerina TaxID=430798 RepID=UPI00360FD5C2
MRVDTGDDSINPETPQSIGILVPAKVKGPNLETKQSYTFVVDVKKEAPSSHPATLLNNSYPTTFL